MSIEHKCENCIYFGMKSRDGMECCLPTDKEWNLELCNYSNFTPNEKAVRQDERKQAYFDIAMELAKDIPILEGNYKYNNFGFQKGYWQGQLEYAYVLKNNLLDKVNRKEL